MNRRSVMSEFDCRCLGRFQLSQIRCHLSFAGLLLAFICSADADEPQSPAHRLIIGWDDAVIVCGPGTVAGMDSPQAIEQMVRRWKGRGHQGIYWRVDEAMLPDQFMTRWKPKVSPGMNYLLERVDQKLQEFLIREFVRYAKKHRRSPHAQASGACRQLDNQEIRSERLWSFGSPSPRRR